MEQNGSVSQVVFIRKAKLDFYLLSTEQSYIVWLLPEVREIMQARKILIIFCQKTFDE